MANDLNRCEFIGRLGQEPTTRYTPDGKAISNFSIACGSSWKEKTTNEKKESVEWIRLVAFGKLAEIVSEYLHKGSQVYVSGRMQTREWEKDGVKRYSTEVVIDTMQMLGSKPSGQSDDKPEAAAPVSAPDFDDDIPF